MSKGISCGNISISFGFSSFIVIISPYAALYDAVDYSHYKATGKLRIVKEKFVENFIRRFSENATLNKTYKVNFYSITESPPSASVEIIAKTGDFKVGDESLNANISTRITAILETNVDLD